jgi:stage III sporulation protein AA
MKLKEKGLAEGVISLMPQGIGDEIFRVALSRKCGTLGISEIMLRRDGRSSVVIGGECVGLSYRLTRDECERLFSRLVGGALYAHRDSIADGYISLDGGVRVGISGAAKYESDRLVGISDIRSLLFRIPTGRCDFADELYSVYKAGIGTGMLIYSPPGVGKTTALRALAHRIGSGRDALRVAVVDERCEFSEGDYSGCEVDILRGYKRREGVEIATRTLSPGLIMIDEIGAEDADQLMTVVRCGIPMIATAHASSFEEVMAKPSLQRILSSSVFSVFVGLSRLCGKYILSVDRI